MNHLFPLNTAAAAEDAAFAQSQDFPDWIVLVHIQLSLKNIVTSTKNQVGQIRNN
jgi:hypothetical protein